MSGSLVIQESAKVDLYPNERAEHLVWKLLLKDFLHPGTIPSDLSLVYNGRKQIDLDRTLKEAGVENGGSFCAIFRLWGD